MGGLWGTGYLEIKGRELLKKQTDILTNNWNRQGLRLTLTKHKGTRSVKKESLSQWIV